MDDSESTQTKVIKNEFQEGSNEDSFKEVPCCSDSDDLFELKLPSSFKPESFSRLKCLERPWEHQEDPEIDIQPYYERFCTAVKEYQEDTLEEKVREWSVDMQFLMPGITCCIRRYVDSLTDDSEIKTFDERLADWVEFGLSLEITERFDSESLKHIELGCSLARRIFLMRRRQFASKLAARHILHRLVDVIESPKFSVLQRCHAADTLFTSLFHCSVTISVFFNQVETDLAGKTCYARVVQLMMQKLPVRIIASLRPVVEFAGFAYSLFLINTLVKQIINNSLTDVDNLTLIKQLGLISDFIFSNDHRNSVPNFYMFRILYESEILSALCVIITSSTTFKRTREVALSFLIKFIAFDGVDISGTYFLASCNTDVIVLCLKIIALIGYRTSDGKMTNVTSVDFYALTLALRTLSLLDELALVNRQENKIIDSEKRIGVLLDVFMLCSNQRSNGGKAVVAALCYSSNIKHLLETFTFGPLTVFDKHVSDDIKTILRHSVCYGYACEILLTLARLQTDGVFWRNHGGIICRLIDSNFISAASSLKQWIEPLREPMAQGTNPSAIYYLVQRLGYYLEKFKNSNDPPLSAITVLRLIDALLKENTQATGYEIFDSTVDRFELLTIFYDENGLQKVDDFLLFAADKHTAQETEKSLYLASDALIFEMLLYSAVSVVETVVQSMSDCGKYIDVSPTLALLKIYAVFCCGYPNRYATVKSKVLGVFSLFLMTDLKENEHVQKRKNCASFIHYFFECGLHPSTIIALSDILAILFSTQLLPQSTLSSGIRLEWKESTNQQLSDMLFLQYSRYLRFIIMTGISSSAILQSSAAKICLCMTRLSLSAANFVVNAIANYCSQSLVLSPVLCLTDCFDDMDSDSDCDEHARSNNDIRFGAAVDFTAASCFKFLTHCSKDLIFRYAFISYLLADPAFTASLLKFFNVASQKTLPHVCFQKQVIVLFKNLCLTLNPTSESGSLALSKRNYEEFCGSLVEYLGNIDQDFATALMSLTALHSIGCFTSTGKMIVLDAFVSKPNALVRFIDRLCNMFDGSVELLDSALKSLMFIMRDIFARDGHLMKVLQWYSGENDKSEVVEGKHPLLSLCALIREHVEVTNHEEYAAFFEKIVKFMTEFGKYEPSEEDINCIEDWTPLKEFCFNIVKDVSIDNLHGMDDESIMDRVLGIEFEPPAVELDMNAFQAEFFQNSGAKYPRQREYEENQSQISRKRVQKKRLERDPATEAVIRA